MSKRCELQKEYYQVNGNYKGSGKYSDDYVMWLENEVLALRQPLVISSFCDCKEHTFYEWEKDENKCSICSGRIYKQNDL
jgi:hypothetical protein